MKKIVIDMRMFGPSDAGLGRYNQQLLAELVKLDLENHYYILFSKKQEIELPDNFKQVVVPYRWYTLAEQISLPRFIDKLQPDIVHFTHFNVPIFYRGKFVVTIHDLVMNHFSDRSTTTRSKLFFWIKRFGYKAVIKHAVKKAEKIITISEFVKDDILSAYKIAEDKIEVIYEGVSKLPDIGRQDKQDYILYVGNAYPHKNLTFLIKSFEKFCLKNQHTDLLLVGHDSYFYQRLKEVVPDSIKSRVIFKHGVGDDKLVQYYAQAKAFVFPSLYEGFGLPGLEALQFSLPVAAARAGSLPEILGEGAVYFDPKNVEQCSATLQSVIGDEKIINELTTVGKKVLAKYSWTNTARQTLRIFQNLL